MGGVCLFSRIILTGDHCLYEKGIDFLKRSEYHSGRENKTPGGGVLAEQALLLGHSADLEWPHFVA